MKRKRKFKLSTTHTIMLSFVFAILMGSLLLSLPISTESGESVSYIDALFTATSATCVTGLVTLPIATTWSMFGQAVILLLIQIGGLGIITIVAGIMVALHKKIGITNSQLVGDAFNLNSLSGLAQFVKKVLLGTFIIEGCGALLYMTVFVPEFGARGIWISVFNSVSAFCNAGMDVISENSLYAYASHPLVNTVTSLLIILGGLGFIVWWDILRVLCDYKTAGLGCFRKLTLHTKIVLSATVLLIVGGAMLIFLFEYNNPLTIGELSLFDKIQASLFQSVTTRTAGFATISQENLTNPTAIVCLILMLVGGSPIGTAGGIKTVTVVVLCATAYSTINNKNEVSIFNRDLSRQTTRKSVAVSCMALGITLVSTVLLSAVTPASVIDIMYETVSATATVGLTRNLTPSLNEIGKIIIMATMYLGRVGPISLAVAFQSKKRTQNIITNPTEEVSIG